MGASETVDSSSTTPRPRYLSVIPGEPLVRNRSIDRESDSDELTRAGREVLAAIAQHHPVPLSRPQAALLAGYRKAGDPWSAVLSELRQRGLLRISSVGVLEVTDGGLAEVGVSGTTPLSRGELIDTWRRSLRSGERAVLDVLIEHYPSTVTLDQIAIDTGIPRSATRFAGYVFALRRFGLIEFADTTRCRASATIVGDSDPTVRHDHRRR